MNQPNENLCSDQMVATELDPIDEALVQEIVNRVVAALDERDDKLLEPREVAKMLGRSRTWVYERSEELKAVRMGSGPKARIGFKRSEVQRFLREQSKKRDEALQAIAGAEETARSEERPRVRTARRRAGRRQGSGPELKARRHIAERF